MPELAAKLSWKRPSGRPGAHLGIMFGKTNVLAVEHTPFLIDAPIRSISGQRFPHTKAIISG